MDTKKRHTDGITTLCEARDLAGLSQTEAARQSQTSQRTWRSWENTGKNARRSPGIAFAWLGLYRKCQELTDKLDEATKKLQKLERTHNDPKIS